MLTFFEDSLIVLWVCQIMKSHPKLVFRCTIVPDGLQDERPQFQESQRENS